jgi:hypothetical protein
VGGLCRSFSTLLGFRYMLLLTNLPVSFVDRIRLPRKGGEVACTVLTFD